MKRRPDGRWQKRIKLPNGKTKLLYSKASTERLAQKDFNEQMLALDTTSHNNTKFNVVADNWNTEYRKRISDINYRKSVRSTYEKIVAHFYDTPIEKLTSKDIYNYIQSLIYQGLSHKTIANYKSVLNMIFTYAIMNDIITNNPAQIITLPSNLPKKQRKLPTDDELKIVNENYNGFELLPYFLLNTGLRKSEALALNYEDIDFENKIIRIYKHLIHDGNTSVIEYKTKTKNSQRNVILLDRLADKLPKNKKGIIFDNGSGKHLSKKEYETRWAQWQKRHNTKITAHQLRHGFATMLYEAGIDLKDAQDLMGHSDIKTTQSIYTHIRDKRKEETANKLNSFVFK